MEISLVYRPNDTVEGRGGSSLHKAFLHYKHASEYINTQPGVQGMRGEKGGWSIKLVDVIDHSIVDLFAEKERLKIAALKKLTDEEKIALGLKISM